LSFFFSHHCHLLSAPPAPDKCGTIAGGAAPLRPPPPPRAPSPNTTRGGATAAATGATAGTPRADAAAADDDDDKDDDFDCGMAGVAAGGSAAPAGLSPPDGSFPLARHSHTCVISAFSAAASTSPAAGISDSVVVRPATVVASA
jgi:hypothetical protein